MAREKSTPAGVEHEASVTPLSVPPHSIEAEQSVIGGLMLDNRAWDERVADIGLKPADFYRYDHRKIFAAIVALAEQNEPLDALTVGEYLERAGHLEEVGGMAYLGDLARNIPSVANIRAYAQIIKERSLLRQIAQICASGMRHAYEAKELPSSAVLEEVERELFALSENARLTSEAVNVKHVLADVLEDIELCAESGKPFSGLDTGLRDLNVLSGGLKPGNLILLGARPSMGKTSLALQLALAALSQPNTEGEAPSCVQFYSMEMPDKDIIKRLLAQKGQLNASRLESGQLGDDDWNRLAAAAQRLSSDAISERLALYDASSLTPASLRARARRSARRLGMPKLIVVDYLQLMSAGDKGENRNLEIASITRALKALALEMRCPVVLLSQLNRALEQRPNKRPYAADLRDSGAIEQDADLILLLYRDEVYHADSDDKGIAEIIVSKNRNGQTGTVKVAWLAEQTRFADLAHHTGV